MNYNEIIDFLKADISCSKDSYQYQLNQGYPPHAGMEHHIACKQAVLDLINRQKAEIEKLSADIKTFENVIKRCFLQAAGGDIDPFAEIKAEAYKEFAERLKAEVVTGVHHLGVFVDIDNLVEEMVGELQ